MRCLIIWGSGFIGTFLIRKLISENHKVFNFDLKDSYEGKIDTFIGDIKNRSDLNKINQKIDSVYILAAVHRDDISNHLEYYKTNFDGINNVLDFCETQNINNIVYYSSASVYGDSFINASEQDKLSPKSHYGKSKLKAENCLIRWANLDNRKLIIIRPSVVYGVGSKSNMNRLINYIIDNKFFIIGKGDNVKSICYVENLVDFTIYIVKKTDSKISIFNYSDFPFKTVRQICDKVSLISKSKNVINVPYFFAYLGVSVIKFFCLISNKRTAINIDRINKSMNETSLSCKKIQSFNFQPKHDLSESIYKTIQR